MVTVIDDYLVEVPDPQRVLLEDVRNTLRELLPNAIETISYGLPCFKVDGKAVGGFAANKTFCSYYPFSGNVLASIAPSIEQFSRTKSALHFTEQQPLPRDLVELLVRTRQNEIAAKAVR